MTDPVTLTHHSFLIDTRAWLAQRTGERHDHYSSLVRQFVRSFVFDRDCPEIGVAGRLQLWCAARGFTPGDAPVIEHHDQRLTKPVTIVFATTPTAPQHALAVVSVDGGPPDVYTDLTDEHFWLIVSTIDIICPGGHRWSWPGGRYLYTADGGEHDVTVLFGPAGTVISRCRDCAAYEAGDREQVCPCCGYAVYCPVCSQRCLLGLPEIPTCQEPHR